MKTQLELVITRYNEDLAWSDIFASIRTVYNKGEHLELQFGAQPIAQENFGLGDFSIANHFATRYETM